MTTVRSERRGAVALITMDRPARLNAISTTLLDDLHAALAAAQADPEVGAIVWTGAGRAFCAGDDLAEFDDQARDEASIRRHIGAIQEITRDVMLGPVPVICAARGYAVGGGFEWLLNCDLVVAGDDLVCFFPELSIGQFPTGAVTALLPAAIGHQRTMGSSCSGERQGAAELRALGLVSRVVPSADVEAEALALAERVAALPRFSTRALKRALVAGPHALEAALAHRGGAHRRGVHAPRGAGGGRGVPRAAGARDGVDSGRERSRSPSRPAGASRRTRPPAARCAS